MRECVLARVKVRARGCIQMCAYMHVSMSECKCDCICARRSVLCVIVCCS